MYAFNHVSPQSVMQYFTYCLRLKDEDYAWLRNVSNDTNQAAVALMAVAALAKNIRECFNERALLALIAGINGENEVVAEQCLANALIILANYDVRIDFFPQIQTAFMDAVSEMGDEGEDAFHTLCALVRSVKYNWRDSIASGELKVEDLPEELQSLLELTGAMFTPTLFLSAFPNEGSIEKTPMEPVMVVLSTKILSARAEIQYPPEAA